MNNSQLKDLVDDLFEQSKNYYYDMIEFFINKELLIENEIGYDEDIENFNPHYINKNFKDLEIKSLYDKFESKLTQDLEILTSLNELLSKHYKNEEIQQFKENIIKIETKRFITTKQFEEKYNVSISSQRDYRGRKNDPLPYRQIKFRGSITYDVDKVEKWFENQHK